MALLLARAGLLLMAANPAHTFVRAVLAVTAPLVAPLAWLDAGQPATGVRFERGSLLMALLLWAGLLLWARWRQRRRKEDHDG